MSAYISSLLLGSTTPILPPTDQNLANVTVFVTFKGVPQVGKKVTIKVKDARPLIIDGAIELYRTSTGTTGQDGSVVLECLKSSKLESNGYRPLHTVQADGMLMPFDITVPDEGGIAGDLKVSPTSD